MKYGLLITAIIAAIATGCTGTRTQNDDTLLMFTGSYAPADSTGIKCYSFNQQTSEWNLISEAAGVSNPSFICVDAENHRLYSVGEDSGNSSTMNMLFYEPDGSGLTLCASDTTGGAAPCHIILSPDGNRVFTANYMGGSISAYTLDSTGHFADTVKIIQFYGGSVDSLRQSQPHLHQLSFIPATGTMLANDLGTDKIYVIPDPYTDEGRKELNIKPGSGPRHTTFDSNGTHAYMLTEISGEINVFDVSGDELTLKQTIAADSLNAEGSADIHLSPDNEFLYASNRLKGDGVVIFKVNPANGTLTRIGFQPTGAHPRNFAITPNGKFLLVACRDTDTIEIYRRDYSTGLLELCGNIPSSRPTCIAFTQAK
ncbi:MAG: lactonase family protein [Paramuribaculum sp.]|nr:lactonase family protein [Paramuribaculum sp.]